MGSMASKLTQEHLEQIARYLTGKFPALSGGKHRRGVRDAEIEIRERIVRVEEELKNQRELLKQGFGLEEKRLEQVDKRFEQVDKRFEQVDKRFEQIDKRFEQVDKRFEQIDKRFGELRDDINRRFTMLMWFSGVGFTLVTAFLTGALVFVK